MSIKHVRRSRPSGGGGVAVRATSFTSTRRRADITRQVDIDSSLGLVGGLVPLTPPYSIYSLKATYEQSNMLRQCVEALVTNVALYGWEIVAASEDTAIDEDERKELQSFIDSANSDESLTTLHANIVEEYESQGNGYAEVIRDGSRRVSILRHADASLMRLCPKDPEAIPIRYDVARGKRTAYVTERKTFRIYAQLVAAKTTYFKEFGDPRKLNYETGKFESKENPVPPDKEATEILHFRQGRGPYGTPRWINQLPSILGSRESEEVNLRYFEDNTVPPMILSVAGGRLTGESYRALDRLLKQQRVGKERQNQIMLIEAVADKESLDEKGATVSLKVDKLSDQRPSDGLFKEYDEANQAKVRSSFRLPPVAVGLSQDVTFATANVSTFVAEMQVYAPARKKFDEIYNKRLINNPQGLNLKTVCLRSRAPAITNPETLIKSLTALNVMGAVTPRTALQAANKILQIELPLYPENGEEGYEPWMDKPIIFSAKGQSGNTGIDPNGAGNTHDTQAVKDEKQKQLEAGGDVSFQSPENGQQ